ncbi:MAG TPA: HutD family protein [Ramlibacter sp.]|nr:HutD family protein [Ramlibacter sp.]
MNWHEVHLDEVFPAPWRNGGGITRELLAWPHKDSWSVRISVAEIAKSGPFSPFPGVARWFAVLRGNGVALKGQQLDARSDPLQFDGGDAVECKLVDGATEDFNLMLQGREGVLRRVKGRHEIACLKGALVGIYSHDHEVAFLAVQVRIVIPPRTLAWNVMPMDERVGFETEGALWFEVTAP